MLLFGPEPARGQAQTTQSGQEKTSDAETVEAAVARLRASPEDRANWIQLNEVFDRLITEDAAEGLMDIALGLTEDFDQTGDAWVLLGKVYLGQAGAILGFTGFEGTFRQSLLYQAADAFRIALDRAPSSLEAGNHLAFTLYLLKNFTGARRETNALIEAHPDAAYPIYILAEIELRSQNPETALRLFKGAHEKDETLLDALYGEVRALIALEKYEAAGDLLVSGAARDPLREELVTLAYSVFEPHENYLDAAGLYRRLLAVAPGRLDLVFFLAVVEYRLDEVALSVQHIKEIVEKDATLDGAHYFEGLLFEKKRLFDDAAGSYREEMKKEGRYFELSIERLRVLAFTKAAAGRYEEAIEIYDSLLPILPFDSVLASNRALALAQCGRIDEADRAYKAILETSPRDSQILNDYALHTMGSGRIERAIELLERAYAIDGNLDACENLAAHHYFVVGDAHRAAHYLTLVLRADPAREKSVILLERINRNLIDQRGD